MALSFLPSVESGYLPCWLLLHVFMGVTHSAVCYVFSSSNPSVALKQFSGPRAPPPTGLLARVYGLKNIYTGMIRLYAAYHINSRELYDLALYTFLGVAFLFTTEIAIWKTSRMREMWFTAFDCGAAIIWMLTQREWYVGK